MRISERKRLLRERGETLAHVADGPPVKSAPVARSKPARTAQVPASGRTSARRPVQQRAAPAPRRQRGPRFYAGFGIVGVFFSLILIQSTISRYHSDQDAYKKALAKYQEALAAHAHTLPKVPSNPTLSIGSFALPALYIALSLAYLGLAYRASRAKRAAQQATS